jgi:hypothetical protein
MNQRRALVAAMALVAGVGIVVPAAKSAVPSTQSLKAGGPIKLLPVRAELAKHNAQAAQATSEGIVPPPTPCPLNGLIPQESVDGIGLIPNCGIPELPIAAGEPYPGTMSYYGGHIQAQPHEYLVLWGWGVRGAFGKSACKSETFAEATISGKQTVTVKCDPDGAGRYMANFISGIGGTN